jgi:hypothetical protein
MANNDTSRFPWIDPTGWMRAWGSLSAAPDQLIQPILPGWTFLVNSNNSSAPQTEMDVVAKYSYGRQIGRMADVLEFLIDERPKKPSTDTRISDFLSMKRDIDELKLDAAATRIEQMTKDLALLKAHDEQQYLRLRDALHEALK